MSLCVVGDFAWDVLIRTNNEVLKGGDSFGEVMLTPGGSVTAASSKPLARAAASDASRPGANTVGESVPRSSVVPVNIGGRGSRVTTSTFSTTQSN